MAKCSMHQERQLAWLTVELSMCIATLPQSTLPLTADVCA
jgi:hypothetical protein